MRGFRIQKSITYAVLLLLSAFFLVPIVFTFTNSFMSAFEVANRYSVHFSLYNGGLEGCEGIHFAEISFAPLMATLEPYSKLLFESPHYLGLFFNSIAITVPIVLGQLIIAVPAAYAFEMHRFRFKESIFFVYIVIMLLPLQVTIVPNFIVSEWLHINGSYWPIILPAVFSPFGVFLVRQSLKGMPYEYIEAAKIDGAGVFQIFGRIILPIIKPAVAALSILTFVEYWNVVDQAVVFISKSVREPLSVYLSRMTGEDGMHMIFAASCFYMLPSVLVFLYGQEYMVEGIQLSGIK